MHRCIYVCVDACAYVCMCAATCGTCSNTARMPESTADVDVAYALALHAAVMLYAHAVTKVLSEGGTLSDGKAITGIVRETTFQGVGGSQVALDNHGDRNGMSYEVINYVVQANSVMGSVPVGIYNSSTLQQYTAYEQEVLWPGSTRKIPISGSLFLADLFLHSC